MSNARKVRDFHEAIGSFFPQKPEVPATDTLQLRYTLLQEEVREVKDEFDALLPRLSAPHTLTVRDLSPLTHELIDLLYVTYGALEALGVDADAAFDEVHRANMHKVSGPKRADGKQLKPEGWQPADVAGLLERLSR